MANNDESIEREERLEKFLDYLSAQRFFLSMAETRAAAAMLDAGFDFIETGDFLRKSPWVAFYRACLDAHHLPETPSILAALKIAFESGTAIEAAGELAIEAFRRHVEGLDAECPQQSVLPGFQSAEVIDFEIETFGREQLRLENWPAWMIALMNDEGEPAGGESAV